MIQKDEKSLLTTRDKYLIKIYGEWFNLVAAGSLFIIYAIIAIFYNSFFKDIIPIPYLLERFPGVILTIMGFFFGGNAIYLITKKKLKEYVLLARGFFDLVSGLMILYLPEFGMMMTMLVMGLALIHIGIKDLTDLGSDLKDFILSVILIPIGLSDIDVINFFLTYDMRVLIFALSLGLLGIFLIYLSKSYREQTKEFFKQA